MVNQVFFGNPFHSQILVNSRLACSSASHFENFMTFLYGALRASWCFVMLQDGMPISAGIPRDGHFESQFWFDPDSDSEDQVEKTQEKREVPVGQAMRGRWKRKAYAAYVKFVKWKVWKVLRAETEMLQGGQRLQLPGLTTSEDIRSLAREIVEKSLAQSHVEVTQDIKWNQLTHGSGAFFHDTDAGKDLKISPVQICVWMHALCEANHLKLGS